MTEQSTIEAADIGVSAGQIWSYLNEHGTVSVNRVVKDLDGSRDLVMQALGWLAREDKIAIEQNGRGRQVSLK